MSKLDGKTEFAGHTLTFNVNTLCALEDAFNAEDVNEVLAKFEALQTRPSMRTLRTIFAVALGVSEEDAGDLMDEVGMEAAAAALGEAIALAFPASDEDAAEVGNAKKKRAGSGKKS